METEGTAAWGRLISTSDSRFHENDGLVEVVSLGSSRNLTCVGLEITNPHQIVSRKWTSDRPLAW